MDIFKAFNSPGKMFSRNKNQTLHIKDASGKSNGSRLHKGKTHKILSK